jgi:SAM-dependent methyltransferase
MSNLTRIVPFSHEYLSEILLAGDTAVDLTAGNGHDTLFLRQVVGAGGKVFAFDLQAKALEKTAERLAAEGLACKNHDTPASGYPPGVHLVNASHAMLTDYVEPPVQAVIANLGYLPGGNRNIVTRSDSTLSALDQAAGLLAPGGRISVVVYVGHEGGEEESQAVALWFAALPAGDWETIRFQVMNRSESPYLLLAEKRR